MKLLTPVVLALLLAAPSLATAQRADADAATRRDAGAKSGEGAAKKAKPRKGAKAAEAQPAGPSPAARSHARRVKSVYIYAAESCARAPDRCDQVLLADTEVRFLEACGACNTSRRCEEERDAVKAGTARASKDPCAP
jgi:hypothetical protein